MGVEIKMPDLATTGEDVMLLRWLVEVGALVRVNEPLFEIETDKATMEVESIAAGYLQAIHALPGERVAIGQVIATIATEVHDAMPIAETVEVSKLETSTIEQVVTAPSSIAQTGSAMTAPSRVSMFARNRVRRQGHGDRIALTATERDVARRLQEAKQTIPHFYLDTSANADHIVALRAASPRRLIWDAFFVQAAARALSQFERMQYRFEGESLVRNPNAIGVALDVDDALFVMPIDDALGQTLETLSEQIMERVRRIKHGDPSARRLGATWLTISNLGGHHIERFHAIVNPPGAAILGVGKIAPEVVATGLHQIAIQQRVRLSLSVDHRVVNGRYASRFLETIVSELENP